MCVDADLAPDPGVRPGRVGSTRACGMTMALLDSIECLLASQQTRNSGLEPAPGSLHPLTGSSQASILRLHQRVS